MVAGLEEISEGELLIGGRRVNDVAPKDRDIAMVFQNYALYPHMTVRENMGYALKKRKTPKDEIDRKVKETAEILDLTEHLDRKPGNMSGGQRQRVAMGRAIVREPQAFLMDEPLSNLDAKLRVQMRGEVARLQKRLGTTTLYVTHDQTEAMTLGDRVAVMRGGHLQQVGPPKELYNDPVNLFVAGFIGSPAMNFVGARLEDGKLRLPFGDVPLEGRLRDRLEANGVRRRRDRRRAPGALRGRPLRARRRAAAEVPHQGRRRGGDGVGAVRLLLPARPTRSTRATWRSSRRTPAPRRSASDSGETVVTARLNADSDAHAGGEAELALDTDKITVFALDGRNLMRAG